MVVGPHDHVARSFAGRIRRVRSVRRGLDKKSGRPERTIDFIGGNVMKAAIDLAGTQTVFGVQPKVTARLQQVECANNIRLDKIAGASDRTVHMRFRREVQNMGDGVLLDHFQNRGFVAEIDFFEHVFRMAGDRFEVREMPGISQGVQVDQFFNLRAINDVLDQIRSDEACSASNK